jgi:hypothetical protein
MGTVLKTFSPIIFSPVPIITFVNDVPANA